MIIDENIFELVNKNIVQNKVYLQDQKLISNLEFCIDEDLINQEVKIIGSIMKIKNGDTVFDGYISKTDNYNKNNEPDFETLAMNTKEYNDLKSIDGSYESFHFQSEAFIKGYKQGFLR